MRQRAHSGLPGFSQETPDACGETLSGMDIAPVAFNLHQNSIVCLPLVSGDKRLIWVPSNQINLQLDGAAELDKAFNRFPYLTQNQTAALAQRCSLHPDQVKVWFMVQRLHYGISWDQKDIFEIQKKFKSSLGKEELQKDGDENEECKGEVSQPGGKKMAEISEEKKANKGKPIGENMRVNKRLERKRKQEHPKKEKNKRNIKELEDDKRDAQKNQKRMTVTEKMEKKKRIEKCVVETAGEGETSDRHGDVCQVPGFMLQWSNSSLKAQTQASNVPPLTDNQIQNICRTPMNSSFDEKTNVEELTNPNGAVTAVTPKAQREVTSNPVVADGFSRVRWHTKTQTQSAMLKQAFLSCQYLDSEGYNQLMKLTGIPRCSLVQWFSDMRYYLRKKKPGWMNEDQHRLALANIRYRQCLNTLTRRRQRRGGRKSTCKMKTDK